MCFASELAAQCRVLPAASRLNNRLCDASESVCSQISLDTIRLLHMLVVKFLTRVVCRTIVLEEQERVAKAHTKAWRMSDNDVSSVSVTS